MQFDDRLATVLRHRAASPRAARTQFRQLLDLLDTPREARDSSLLAAAWLRLGALGGIVPAGERATILHDPSVRIRNPELAAHLAEDEPEVAAAALAKARLSEDDWATLIPRLPIRARGFLRLRRDLPDGATAVLDRLGIHDRGLPIPERNEGTDETTLPVVSNDDEPHVSASEAEPDPAPAPLEEDTEIGELVKRIERFRRDRGSSPHDPQAPRLPLGDKAADDGETRMPGFAFTTDGEGRIDWTDADVPGAIIGIRLGQSKGELAGLLRRRQPLAGSRVTLEGAPAIAGDWVIDASSRFDPLTGNFAGYAGRFRRALDAAPAPDAQATEESNRIRQLLHELRTPVNAIQGFAEVIQQQLFGPTPHEYRALAANIAGDSARILAGFDELDRLAKLETGALEPEAGKADLTAAVSRIASQLESVLAARTAGFELDIGKDACPVPFTTADADALVWRVLATIAGAVGAGEHLDLSLAQTDTEALLTCDLPAALAAEQDIFTATAKTANSPLSAGAFGAGFAFRLARAEALSIGGSLAHIDDTLLLVLPLLTDPSTLPSAEIEPVG